ncbi:MAG: cyclic nucleotide-binding domain-containing protein, partial [Pseudomonadota bacterium]
MTQTSIERAEIGEEVRSQARRALKPGEIEILSRYGDRRSYAPGEYIFEAGIENYTFAVVLSGEVHILDMTEDGDGLVSRVTENGFLGELGLLSGQAPFLSCKVIQPTEVLELDGDALHDVINQVPEVGDIIVSSFSARRELLMKAATANLTILGPETDRNVTRAREFVSRNRIPHRFLDSRDAQGLALAQRLEIGTD